MGGDVPFNANGLLEHRQEMYEYYADAIKCQQTRDDYLELLTLCRTFWEVQIEWINFMPQAPFIKVVGWQSQFTA